MRFKRWSKPEVRNAPAADDASFDTTEKNDPELAAQLELDRQDAEDFVDSFPDDPGLMYIRVRYGPGADGELLDQGVLPDPYPLLATLGIIDKERAKKLPNYTNYIIPDEQEYENHARTIDRKPNPGDSDRHDP